MTYFTEIFFLSYVLGEKILSEKVPNSCNSLNVSLCMLSVRALVSLFYFLIDSFLLFRIRVLKAVNKKDNLSYKGWGLGKVDDFLVNILL